MIAFYDSTGELILVKVYEDYSITHKSDGCDQMQFNAVLCRYKAGAVPFNSRGILGSYRR